MHRILFWSTSKWKMKVLNLHWFMMLISNSTKIRIFNSLPMALMVLNINIFQSRKFLFFIVVLMFKLLDVWKYQVFVGGIVPPITYVGLRSRIQEEPLLVFKTNV